MKARSLPISIHVNTIKSMADLINIFTRIATPVDAKELITSIVFNAITEIQEEGLFVTEEELQKRINSSLNDFLEVAKKTNVA